MFIFERNDMRRDETSLNMSMHPSIRNSPRWVLYHGEVTAPFQGGSQEDEEGEGGGRSSRGREKFGRRFAQSEKEASDGGHHVRGRRGVQDEQEGEEEKEDENEDEED